MDSENKTVLSHFLYLLTNKLCSQSYSYIFVLKKKEICSKLRKIYYDAVQKNTNLIDIVNNINNSNSKLLMFFIFFAASQINFKLQETLSSTSFFTSKKNKVYSKESFLKILNKIKKFSNYKNFLNDETIDAFNSIDDSIITSFTNKIYHNNDANLNIILESNNLHELINNIIGSKLNYNFNSFQLFFKQYEIKPSYKINQSIFHTQKNQNPLKLTYGEKEWEDLLNSNYGKENRENLGGRGSRKSKTQKRKKHQLFSIFFPFISQRKIIKSRKSTYSQKRKRKNNSFLTN